MAENTKGRLLLTEKDFVSVVDAEGNELPSVPKHWGTDQLPAGAEKKKSAKASSSPGSSTSSAPPVTPPVAPVDDFPSYTDKPRPADWSSFTDDQKRAYIYDRAPKPEAGAQPKEPAGNASTDEWAAYAREKGATDADLVDADGKPLGQKALREKYGTPAS